MYSVLVERRLPVAGREDILGDFCFQVCLIFQCLEYAMFVVMLTQEAQRSWRRDVDQDERLSEANPVLVGPRLQRCFFLRCASHPRRRHRHQPSSLEPIMS